MTEVTKKHRSRRYGFMDASSRLKGKSREDQTSLTATSMTESVVTDSDFFLSSPRRFDTLVTPSSAKSLSSSTTKERQGLNLARAASYLLHRSPGSPRRLKLEKLDIKDFPTPPEKLDLARRLKLEKLDIKEFPTPPEKLDLALNIDDRFYRDMNRCTPTLVGYLRKQRSEYPIVCYESDDDSVKQGTNSVILSLPSGDTAILSRIEALQVQERLLGSDHPDVQFLSRHIGRRLRNHHGSMEVRSQPKIANNLFSCNHFPLANKHTNGFSGCPKE